MSERDQPASGATLAIATLFSLAFAVAVPLDLLPWLRGPAPYPPEWQWELRSPPAALPPAAAFLLLVTLLLLAASGSSWLARRERAAACGLVGAAIALGLLLPPALLAREGNGALRTLLARTSSFSVTSYHTAALSDEARDPIAFVRRHAELLPQLALTAKHAATHPVGPVLLFRASIAACESWPGLTRALLAAAGVPEREFALPPTRPARAGALLGALALGLCAALTAWPLAALAEALGLTPLAAARAALLWVLLPAPALVAPRFDAAIALPLTAFAALVFRAARSGRLVVLPALLAGVCAGLALLLSYGAAAFLALAGLAAGAALAAASHEERTRRLAALAAALLASAAVAVAIAFGIPAAVGGHPFAALRTALAIHREAYTTPRSYRLWLLFDGIDFAALFGVGLAFLAAAAAVGAARQLRPRATAPRRALFALALLLGVALLVVSGATRGEVGRLWIPLMPLVLAGAAPVWAAGSPVRGAPEAAVDTDDPRPALLAGLLCTLSTVAVAAAWRL